MISNNIDVFGTCSTEYGNPSGHSLQAGSFLLTIFFYYFHNSKYVIDSKSLYAAVLTLFILIIFMIGFSRLYNSMHTAN
jgi:hypothetical protein